MQTAHLVTHACAYTCIAILHTCIKLWNSSCSHFARFFYLFDSSFTPRSRIFPSQSGIRHNGGRNPALTRWKQTDPPTYRLRSSQHELVLNTTATVFLKVLSGLEFHTATAIESFKKPNIIKIGNISGYTCIIQHPDPLENKDLQHEPCLTTGQG